MLEAAALQLQQARSAAHTRVRPVQLVSRGNHAFRDRAWVERAVMSTVPACAHASLYSTEIAPPPKAAHNAWEAVHLGPLSHHCSCHCGPASLMSAHEMLMLMMQSSQAWWDVLMLISLTTFTTKKKLNELNLAGGIQRGGSRACRSGPGGPQHQRRCHRGGRGLGKRSQASNRAGTGCWSLSVYVMAGSGTYP